MAWAVLALSTWGFDSLKYGTVSAATARQWGNSQFLDSYWKSVVVRPLASGHGEPVYLPQVIDGIEDDFDDDVKILPVIFRHLSEDVSGGYNFGMKVIVFDVPPRTAELETSNRANAYIREGRWVRNFLQNHVPSHELFHAVQSRYRIDRLASITDGEQLGEAIRESMAEAASIFIEGYLTAPLVTAEMERRPAATDWYVPLLASDEQYNVPGAQPIAYSWWEFFLAGQELDLLDWASQTVFPGPRSHQLPFPLRGLVETFYRLGLDVDDANWQQRWTKDEKYKNLRERIRTTSLNDGRGARIVLEFVLHQQPRLIRSPGGRVWPDERPLERAYLASLPKSQHYFSRHHLTLRAYGPTGRRMSVVDDAGNIVNLVSHEVSVVEGSVLGDFFEPISEYSLRKMTILIHSPEQEFYIGVLEDRGVFLMRNEVTYGTPSKQLDSVWGLADAPGFFVSGDENVDVSITSLYSPIHVATPIPSISVWSVDSRRPASDPERANERSEDEPPVDPRGEVVPVPIVPAEERPNPGNPECNIDLVPTNDANIARVPVAGPFDLPGLKVWPLVQDRVKIFYYRTDAGQSDVRATILVDGFSLAQGRVGYGFANALIAPVPSQWSGWFDVAIPMEVGGIQVCVGCTQAYFIGRDYECSEWTDGIERCQPSHEQSWSVGWPDSLPPTMDEADFIASTGGVSTCPLNEPGDGRLWNWRGFVPWRTFLTVVPGHDIAGGRREAGRITFSFFQPRMVPQRFA